jgi:16S rRNA (guanine527-N7)-methyltransferase
VKGAYGPDDLMADLGVPRETCERLETHRALLARWAPRINLIGPRELEAYWRRHALDCGQLVGHAPDALRWIDIGSGAGFPGIVIGCILAGRAGAQVDLVETNPKKAAFLREAVRETGAAARVLNASIDEVAGASADYHIVTARAFAPLPRIISSAKPILDRGAIGLFLKGAEYRAELAAAADEGWTLRVEALPSMSDPEGRILRIEGAERVGKNDRFKSGAEDGA